MFGWQVPLKLHSCPTQTCPRSEHQIMVIRSIISRFVEALIPFSPLEVFPRGKCCFFAIVCGHQPSVHTLPEFDAGLNLITLRQELIKFPYSKRRSTTHFLIFQFAQLGPRLQCHKGCIVISLTIFTYQSVSADPDIILYGMYC